MPALDPRIVIALALVAIGAFGGGYVMWGQVQDARASAQAATQKAEELGKSLETVIKNQAAADALLAGRKRKDNELNQQLIKLRSDLDGALKDEPTWSADCIPGAVADRLRLPADKDCPGTRSAP